MIPQHQRCNNIYRYLIIQLLLLSFNTVSDLDLKAVCYDKLTIGFLSEAVTLAHNVGFWEAVTLAHNAGFSK